MLEELKVLIVEELLLEDVRPEDIDVNAPLFGGGLGLDSIDALELSTVLQRKYGVRVKTGDKRNDEYFANVQGLAKFITDNRTQ